MNGRAEHFNCTINEKAESMHHQACLPDSWWELCILHANYLYNCTPMQPLDWKTPKGYLEKVDPDISHLHILGCRAYIFIHKDLQARKLSPKSELMTFLGFHDDCGSNLMFMCPSNNIIFMAATALFDECLFLRSAKESQVPPVTQIQEPEEPEIIIDTETMPDNNTSAPFIHPHDYIPPGDN